MRVQTFAHWKKHDLDTTPINIGTEIMFVSMKIIPQLNVDTSENVLMADVLSTSTQSQQGREGTWEPIH